MHLLNRRYISYLWQALQVPKPHEIVLKESNGLAKKELTENGKKMAILEEKYFLIGNKMTVKPDFN